MADHPETTAEVDLVADWYKKEVALLGPDPGRSDRWYIIGMHGRADGRFGCEDASAGWRVYLRRSGASL